MIQKNIEGFEGLSIESDTTLLRREKIEVGGISAVYERWRWDGLRGETLVFRDADANHHDDAALEELARSSGYIDHDSSITISRNRDGYSFVNFNFAD